MAIFEITAPDGRKFRIEGANQEGALRALQQMLGVPAPAGPSAMTDAPAMGQPGQTSPVGAPPRPAQAYQRMGSPQAMPGQSMDAPTGPRQTAIAAPQTVPFVPEEPMPDRGAPMTQTPMLQTGIADVYQGLDDGTVRIGDRYHPAGTTPEMASRIPPGMIYDPQTGQYRDVPAETAAMDRSRTDAAIGGAMQGVGLNAGDEVIGGVTGFFQGPARGDLAQERARATLATDAQQYPGTVLASQIAGAVATPGLGAAKMVANAGTRLGQAGLSAGIGAVTGAVTGFMNGEGGFQNRLAEAAPMAALGGLFGAAAPKITEVLTRIPAGVASLFQRSQERPTVEVLRAVKNAAYQAVDQSGLTFDGPAMTRLSQTVRQAFDADNYVAEVDDASRATLAVLGNREGQATTLSQLDSIRQNLWQRYSRASDQPRILDAISQIDDLVETTAVGSDIMAVARAANARFAKSQLLENAFQRAQDVTAATGSGGNIVNKYRQAIASIINNRRELRFFSQPEIDVMRQFVRGSMPENVSRLIGKLAPTGNGLMMSLHIIGGVASQGASVPLMAVGAAAKGMADRGVMRGADRLLDMTAGIISPQAIGPQPFNALSSAGTLLAAPGASLALEPTRNALQR